MWFLFVLIPCILFLKYKLHNVFKYFIFHWSPTFVNLLSPSKRALKTQFFGKTFRFRNLKCVSNDFLGYSTHGIDMLQGTKIVSIFRSRSQGDHKPYRTLQPYQKTFFCLKPYRALQLKFFLSWPYRRGFVEFHACIRNVRMHHF